MDSPCGNVNVISWGLAMYPCQFHAMFNALLSCSTCYWPVPGLFGLFLACSLLVTGLLLACSACYWLVPLVPCFSNVGQQIFTLCSNSLYSSYELVRKVIWDPLFHLIDLMILNLPRKWDSQVNEQYATDTLSCE